MPRAATVRLTAMLAAVLAMSGCDPNVSTPAEASQRVRDSYDELRQRLLEMDGLFHAASVNVATVTEIAGRWRARNDDPSNLSY